MHGLCLFFEKIQVDSISLAEKVKMIYKFIFKLKMYRQILDFKFSFSILFINLLSFRSPKNNFKLNVKAP